MKLSKKQRVDYYGSPGKRTSVKEKEAYLQMLHEERAAQEEFDRDLGMERGEAICKRLQNAVEAVNDENPAMPLLIVKGSRYARKHENPSGYKIEILFSTIKRKTPQKCLVRSTWRGIRLANLRSVRVVVQGIMGHLHRELNVEPA